MLTDEDVKALRSLRDRGFAVVVWNPEELKGAPPTKVEDRSIELGWEVIEALGDRVQNGDDEALPPLFE